MAKDPFLPFMQEVTKICNQLTDLYRYAEWSEREWSEWERVERERVEREWECGDSYKNVLSLQIDNLTFRLSELYCHTSLVGEKEQLSLIGGRRVADAIVVSAVVLLSFAYLYLIGYYIDRGGSKTGSSSSLDFRDIYISIVLFQAAYVWIKFRDVIPQGAVYQRPGSSKWGPRIKFPVIRGVGGKSKRIPLGSYDTKVEGEVGYQIASFYCKKRKHTGRLDLGGGAYFPIPARSVDPSK